MSGAINPPKKPPADSEGDLDEESEEEDHNHSSQGRSKSTWANYPTKNLRKVSKGDDSDSDFDL
jgi:hypothetical protein